MNPTWNQNCSYFRLIHLNFDTFITAHMDSLLRHSKFFFCLVKPFILLQTTSHMWGQEFSFMLHALWIPTSPPTAHSIHRECVSLWQYRERASDERQSQLNHWIYFVEIPLRKPCFRFVSLPWIFGDSYEVFDWYGMSSRISMVCDSLLYSSIIRFNFRWNRNDGTREPKTVKIWKWVLLI